MADFTRFWQNEKKKKEKKKVQKQKIWVCRAHKTGLPNGKVWPETNTEVLLQGSPKIFCLVHK